MDDLCKAWATPSACGSLLPGAAGGVSMRDAGDLVCACDIERLVGLAQPTVSHHMRILVSAGLVTGRKSDAGFTTV